MTKFPGYHLLIGITFLLIELAAKSSLPALIGSSPYIQLPCAFLSAVFIPFGTFLAFYALVVGTGNRRKLLAEFLTGLSLLIALLAFYFFTYQLLSRVAEMQNDIRSVLPQLVTLATTGPTETKREQAAAIAYQLYGSVIAYRQDDGQVVFYQPSPHDVTLYQNAKQSDSTMRQQFLFIKKMTGQFVYLFGLYAATFLTAFLVGGICLIVKSPKADSLSAT